MKKILTLMLLLSMAAGISAQEKQKEITKTGFNFGPLPVIGYSSDMGFHYGALLNTFYYGDGSVYPDYRWLLKTEASWYTKGNSVYHVYFDSKHLIPGIRVSAAVSYFGNKSSAFYGFNGAASLYAPKLDKITSAGQGFYLMRRDIFRIVTGFQGQIGDSHWNWAAGLNFYDIKAGHAENRSLKGYDKKAKKPAEDYSLYDMYLDYGIIPEAEAKGGRHLEGLVGLVFDTRDHENNPSRGTNLEVMIYGSPDIINGRSDWRSHYLKAAVHFKQFFPLVKDHLIFGGHLAYQGTIAGHTPFYMLPTIQFINMKQNNNEGLGSTSTLRGTVFNRLQGEGYAWGNFELRWNFVRFKLFRQNFILALNPFFDLGAVVQPYRLEEMKNLLPNDSQYSLQRLTAPVAVDDDGQGYWPHQFYTGNKEKLHMSAGSGLHIIMNQNFNINFEVGKCFDKNDGDGLGINVGLNYIF